MLFTLIPLLFSLKLFMLALSVLIIALTSIGIKKTIEAEKLKFKTSIEYCLNKIPPNLEKQTCRYDDNFSAQEFLIVSSPSNMIIETMELTLAEEIVKKVHKAIGGIFHVPKISFVEN